MASHQDVIDPYTPLLAIVSRRSLKTAANGADAYTTAGRPCRAELIRLNEKSVGERAVALEGDATPPPPALEDGQAGRTSWEHVVEGHPPMTSHAYSDSGLRRP